MIFATILHGLNVRLPVCCAAGSVAELRAEVTAKRAPKPTLVPELAIVSSKIGLVFLHVSDIAPCVR